LSVKIGPMKPIRAFLFALWIYSSLIWLYILARVTINNIDPTDLFIHGIPIAIWELGIMVFLISAVSFYALLVRT